MAEKVDPAMRERLSANRSGKLTPNQWIDVVTQPIMRSLVFMLPLGFLLLPWIFRFLMRGWRALPLILLICAVVIIFRAVRYARAAVHFDHLHAQGSSGALWKFWSTTTLYNENEKALKFRVWLAPRTNLLPDRDYIVYYLHDGPDNYVLLSIAPANHPDAEHWLPNSVFRTRQQRRT